MPIRVRTRRTGDDEASITSRSRRRAATAHLVAHSVTMLSDEMDYINRKLRLFKGPEGITLELVQRDS